VRSLIIHFKGVRIKSFLIGHWLTSHIIKEMLLLRVCRFSDGVRYMHCQLFRHEVSKLSITAGNVS
jgi:hypothetical protein